MSDKYIQTMLKHARHFGLLNRTIQSIEELSELSQALCKFQRAVNKDKTLRVSQEDINKHIIEEIADVEICLTELKYLLCIVNQVEEVKEQKIERTENLIHENTERKNKNGL